MSIGIDIVKKYVVIDFFFEFYFSLKFFYLGSMDIGGDKKKCVYNLAIFGNLHGTVPHTFTCPCHENPVTTFYIVSRNLHHIF